MVGGNIIRNLQFAAGLKPLNHLLEIDVGKIFAEYAANGGANEFPCYDFRALQFTFIFEFELAGNGGKCGINIGNSGDGMSFASPAACCSALLTTLSSAVMGRRWLTPERRSTRLSSRA